MNNVRVYWFKEKDGNEQSGFISYDFNEEELMDLKKLEGDGRAQISVSTEFKKTQNYQSAGATVVITLTCDQDERTIRVAATQAGVLANELATAHLEEAWASRQEIK